MGGGRWRLEKKPAGETARRRTASENGGMQMKLTDMQKKLTEIQLIELAERLEDNLTYLGEAVISEIVVLTGEDSTLPLEKETLYLASEDMLQEVGEDRARIWTADCRNTGSPVVVLPRHMRAGEAAYELQRLLTAHYRRQYKKVVEINLRFADITLKEPDLKLLVGYFEKIMKNPVIIYDEFFNIVLSTDRYLERYERDLSSMERCTMTNLFYYKQRVLFDDEDAPKPSCIRLLFPVLLGDMAKGYLAIFDVNTPYEKMDIPILEIFANSVLVEMKRLLDLRNVEEKYVSDFLYDVVFRITSKGEEIKRRARVLNLEERADYCIIAVEPRGRMKDVTLDVNGYITQYEYMSDRIMNCIQNFIHSRFKRDVVTKFDRTVLILHRLHQCGEGEGGEDICQTCGWLLKNVDKLFDGMAFQIGIGTVTDGIDGIGASYHHALAALSYGAILHGEGGGFIISYEDSSMLKVFSKLKETDTLYDIIPENLLQIRRWDEAHGSNFYGTLKVYLDCSCNAKKSSQVLFIHYKTMLYRLDKLKRQFGVHLENSYQRLHIELGIQMLDIMNLPKISL